MCLRGGVTHCSWLCDVSAGVSVALLSPDPVLCGQVFLLIVSGLRTEHTLIEACHDVLLHLIHHSLYLLRRTYKGVYHTHKHTRVLYLHSVSAKFHVNLWCNCVPLK